MAKYPKTPHLSFSPNWHGDDTRLIDENHLLNKPLIQLEKMDGENQALFKEGFHARSVDSKMTPWRKITATIHGHISYLLYPDEIIYGENMFAIHSINYEKLDSYFYVFNIIQNNIYLSWVDIEKRCSELNLKTVPVINRINPVASTRELKENLILPSSSFYGSNTEGYVVRNSEAFHKDEFDQNVAKFVRSDHCGTGDTAHWTKTWKQAKLISA